MTEDWTGRAVDVPPTTFSVTDNGSTQTTIITRPDGAQLTQITDSNQSSATYGMLLEDLLKDNGAVLSHSNAFWEVGAYNSPRPTRTEQYDELGRMTATTYGYDGNSGSLYNSVTDQRAYGYSGELLRRVHTEYLNNGNYNGSLQNSGTLWWKQDGTLSGGPIWGGPHIFNLATLTEIYAEDDATRLSRAEYQYDGSNLTDNPGIVQYDPGTVSQYRGNVTQIKRYADAASLDQSTAVVGARTYDIAGNVRVQTTSCCQQMSFAYTTSTQYAWPDSQTDGSPSDQNTQNITSATYDFNTGLVNTSTDANGRPTTITYDPNTLRPTFEDFSTGAYQSHIYDDLNMVVNDFVYENGQSGSNVASRSDRYFDGLGRVIKEIAYGKDYVQDVVETKFDNMGRVWQQTRPYRSGAETPQWNTVIYDPLNRPTQTTSPDLVSVITRTYNPPDPPNASGQPGQTVKVTDSWGRERWARTDALGRLVEVAEPDPGGSGALSSGTMYTTYDYDALDRLVQVNQDQQTRKFRYDALSRLTHQKLAERDATLDDNGNYVGGGSWSDVFSYDLRSNLTQSVDARGVKTYFKYNNDPLNRLQSVQYDKSGSPANLRANITDAPNVSYGYVTSGDKKRAQSVTVSNGMGNEQLIYDSEGRLAQVSQTFAGRESYPIVTSYIWDSLDRLKENDYPQQYGMGEVRKKV
ncbi:MAG: hypothetical protein J2P41_02320, partial [Blastocatellia bacterium]|nr:hypothetical protein [Blastocatellia bacterium]